MKVNNGLALVAANMNPKTKHWSDPLFPLASPWLTGRRRHNVSRYLFNSLLYEKDNKCKEYTKDTDVLDSLEIHLGRYWISSTLNVRKVRIFIIVLIECVV